MRKVFFISWALAVLFSVFVLTGMSRKDFGRKFVYRDARDGFSGGGLYRNSKLDFFKERIPEVKKPLDSTLEDAQIITFGDSFLGVEMESPFFAVELQEKAKVPVYNKTLYADFGSRKVDFNPLNFLKSVGYEKGPKKYMILETVERFALRNAEAYRPSENEAASETPGLFKRVYSGARWRMRAFDELARKNFIHLNNNNYDLKYFFMENIFAYPITHLIANARFRLLAEVDPAIGAYSIDRKMLFYSGGVEFNRTVKTKETLDKMADNIEYLARRLKDDYNIELIYVIAPNKYSVYSDYVEGKHVYDDFIPEVTRRLRQKGVKTIDAFSAYMEYRRTDDSRLLYFKADEHYAALGKSIMVDLALEQIAADQKPGAVKLSRGSLTTD